MGTTGDLFKKVRCQANISYKDEHQKNNDRNGMDQTEAGDIKKSWQKYTEELSKK